MIDSCKQIENFKNNILYDINNSNLTIGCAYYIFKDIFFNLEKEYYNTLKIEEEEGVSAQTAEETIDINTLVSQEKGETVTLDEAE